MLPEGRREGDVDFVQGAVGDAVDGLGETGREGGCEGGLVAFQPAERRGDDDFVEGEG